jgi:hypothetical protein
MAVETLPCSSPPASCAAPRPGLDWESTSRLHRALDAGAGVWVFLGIVSSNTDGLVQDLC